MQLDEDTIKNFLIMTKWGGAGTALGPLEPLRRQYRNCRHLTHTAKHQTPVFRGQLGKLDRNSQKLCLPYAQTS